MIRAVALITALWPAAVIADPDRVSILLGARHIGGAGLEEFNPGVFVTWERRVDWSVGVYRNSYGNGSIAATVAAPVARWRGGEAAIFGGVAWYPGTGRHEVAHVGDVVPIGGLQVRHGNAFAQFIPLDGKPVAAVVSFGLTFRLGGSD